LSENSESVENFISSVNELVFVQSFDQIIHAVNSQNSSFTEFFIAMSGAFFGALSAFCLNWLAQYRKERQQKNTKINEAINLLSLNISWLIQYKTTFLYYFSDELKRIGEHAANYPEVPKSIGEVEQLNLKMQIDRLGEEWETRHMLTIRKLITENETDDIKANLNGLLLKWDSPSTENINLSDLHFVSQAQPKILELVYLANSQATKLIDIAKHRGESYAEGKDAIKNEMWQPNTSFMKVLYQMIDARENMGHCANDVIIFSQAALILLILFQEEMYPRRGMFHKFFFGSYGWSRPQEFDALSELMPDQKEYKRALGEQLYSKIEDYF